MAFCLLSFSIVSVLNEKDPFQLQQWGDRKKLDEVRKGFSAEGKIFCQLFVFFFLLFIFYFLFFLRGIGSFDVC